MRNRYAVVLTVASLWCGVQPAAAEFYPDVRLDTSQVIDRTTPAQGCDAEVLNEGAVIRCAPDAQWAIPMIEVTL